MHQKCHGDASEIIHMQNKNEFDKTDGPSDGATATDRHNFYRKKNRESDSCGRISNALMDERRYKWIYGDMGKFRYEYGLPFWTADPMSTMSCRRQGVIIVRLYVPSLGTLGAP